MEKKYTLDLGFVMAKYGKKRIESQVRKLGVASKAPVKAGEE